MEQVLEIPFMIVSPKKVTRYRYQLMNVILNKEATLIIDLFNEQRQVEQVIRKIEGEEYAAWVDDSYVLAIVNEEIEKLKVPV
jgi:hypothetical protein